MRVECLFYIRFGCGSAALNSFAQQEKNYVEVYSLGLADARSAMELAKAIVSPPIGGISSDEAHCRLLVIATKEKHAQLEEMTRDLNASPKNVRIETRFSGFDNRTVGAGMEPAGELTRNEGITHTTIGKLIRQTFRPSERPCRRR
jgi:hypothetical protein